MDGLFLLLVAILVFILTMKEFNNIAHRKDELKFYFRFLLCSLLLIMGYIVLKVFDIFLPINKTFAEIITFFSILGIIYIAHYMERIYPYKK